MVITKNILKAKLSDDSALRVVDLTVLYSSQRVRHPDLKRVFRKRVFRYGIIDAIVRYRLDRFNNRSRPRTENFVYVFSNERVEHFLQRQHSLRDFTLAPLSR